MRRWTGFCLLVLLLTGAPARAQEWAPTPADEAQVDLFAGFARERQDAVWDPCMAWASSPGRAVSACTQTIAKTRTCGGALCFRIRSREQNLAILHTARGSARGLGGDYQGALADFSQALAYYPRNAQALVNRGVAQAELGDLEAARRDFTAALSLQPGNATAKANLAGLDPPPAVARAEPVRPEPPPIRQEPQRTVGEAPSRADAERREAEAVTARAEARAAKALVQRAQAALAALGYKLGAPDGVAGRQTRQALDAYRQQAGLTGRPLDEAFIAGLEAAAAGQRRLAEARAREEAARREAERVAAQVPPAPRPAPPAPPRREAQAAPSEPAPPGPPPAAIPGAGGKVALVIGNGAYTTPEVPRLPNPPNDARDVAAALTRIGFKVFEGIDLDRLQMEDLAVEFAKAAAGADMALVFYAGHGLQARGRNYLVPTDGRLEGEYDLRRLIAADDLVEDASQARQVAVVMLDACRDNPLSRSLAGGLGRSVAGTGLARPSEVPGQTLIAYATAEGAVAADGSGRNSPFTAGLLKHLAAPGLEIRLLFGKVRDEVITTTGGRQRPNIYGDLGGEPIFLVPPAAEPRDAEPALTLDERRGLQGALAALGHYQGPQDGTLSGPVRAAIRDFQGGIGAPATGYLSLDQLGEAYRLARERRPPEALPTLNLIEVLRQSEADEPRAAFLRGLLHDSASAAGPLPKDDAEAARWYGRAAKAGNADAALNLARLYQTGRGVAPDPGEAARLLRGPAAAGDARAQLELGDLLLAGSGVARDEAEAARLLRLAAAQPGGAEAMARLRLLEAGRP